MAKDGTTRHHGLRCHLCGHHTRAGSWREALGEIRPVVWVCTTCTTVYPSLYPQEALQEVPA